MFVFKGNKNIKIYVCFYYFSVIHIVTGLEFFTRLPLDIIHDED